MSPSTPPSSYLACRPSACPSAPQLCPPNFSFRLCPLDRSSAPPLPSDSDANQRDNVRCVPARGRCGYHHTAARVNRPNRLLPRRGGGGAGMGVGPERCRSGSLISAHAHARAHTPARAHTHAHTRASKRLPSSLSLPQLYPVTFFPSGWPPSQLPPPFKLLTPPFPSLDSDVCGPRRRGDSLGPLLHPLHRCSLLRRSTSLQLVLSGSLDALLHSPLISCQARWSISPIGYSRPDDILALFRLPLNAPPRQAHQTLPCPAARVEIPRSLDSPPHGGFPEATSRR